MKLGICLSGGGAKGAYQVGALQALKELGLFDQAIAFSGTSIGSVNLAVVLGSSIEETREVWFRMPSDPIPLVKPMKQRLVDKDLNVAASGIFRMNKLDEILENHMHHEELEKHLLFVTVSESGDPKKGFLEVFKNMYLHYVKKDSKVAYIPIREIPRENRISIIEASASIPIVFRPVVEEDTMYYDGGLYDTKPVKPLVEHGCDTVVLIDISMKLKINNTMDLYPNIKLHHITPSGEIGKTLDFSLDHTKATYEMGYLDTLTYFKHHQI